MRNDYSFTRRKSELAELMSMKGRVGRAPRRQRGGTGRSLLREFRIDGESAARMRNGNGGRVFACQYFGKRSASNVL